MFRLHPASNNWVIAGALYRIGESHGSRTDMSIWSLPMPNIWFMADSKRSLDFTLPESQSPGSCSTSQATTNTWLRAIPHSTETCVTSTSKNSTGRATTIRLPTGLSSGVWEPLALDHEVIHVPWGREDVLFDVQSTAHGPLLSPLFTRVIPPLSQVGSSTTRRSRGCPFFSSTPHPVVSKPPLL